MSPPPLSKVTDCCGGQFHLDVNADPPIWLATAHRALEWVIQRNRNSVATDIPSYRSVTEEKLDLASLAPGSA